MDAATFQSNWTTLEPIISEKWKKLDLTKIEGKQENFLTQLQQKYGINREQATKELASLDAKLGKTGVAHAGNVNPNTPPYGKNPKGKR